MVIIGPVMDEILLFLLLFLLILETYLKSLVKIKYVTAEILITLSSWWWVAEVVMLS